MSIAFVIASKMTRSRIKMVFPDAILRKQYIRISFETGCYAGLTTLAVWGVTQIFSLIGSGALAIQQIGNQIFQIAYLPQMGFFVAISVILGKLYGANRHDLLLPAFLKIASCSILLSLILSLGSFFFAPKIVLLFCPNDASVFGGIQSVIALICLDQILSSCVLMVKAALTGISDTRFVLWAMFITGYFVLIPLTYILGISFNLGIMGGYIALAVWSVIEISVLIPRFIWKQRQMRLKLAPVHYGIEYSIDPATQIPEHSFQEEIVS